MSPGSSRRIVIDDLPLTGSDAFLLALDYESRTHNDASHLAQFTLKTDDGFRVERFAEEMNRLTRTCPILTAPISRPYFFKPPHYRLSKYNRSRSILTEERTEVMDGIDIPEMIQERLNEIRNPARGQLLDIDLYPVESGGWWISFTWLHMLFDGRGIETFVDRLARIGRGELEPVEQFSENEVELSSSGGSFLERLSVFRDWGDTMKEWSDPSPSSLAGPLDQQPKQLRYHLEQFSREETEKLKSFVRDRLGMGIPMLFYLALSIRAHRAVFQVRGEDPGKYFVPVTVNNYPDAQQRPLFRTHVSFLWFRVAPTVAESLDDLLELLKSQRLEMIKDRVHEQFHDAMSITRYFPRWLNARMMRRETEGELASFFFSYTGDLLPETDQFFGGAIEKMIHAPAPPASPGSSFIWSLRSGRLQLTHLYDIHAVAPEEREIAMEALRGDVSRVID